MDIEEMRESGDEQEFQEDRDDDIEDEIENRPSINNDRERLSESNIDEIRQENRSASAKTSRHNRNKPKAETSQNFNRSLSQPQPKRKWRTANAFINFVQDFRKDHPDVPAGRNIFQVCGERWKGMTPEQKEPYIAAAKTVKRLKQRKIGDNSDQVQAAKKSVSRVSKKKNEIKRKELIQKRSKDNKPDPKSNSDTDTAETTVHSSMSDAESI